MKVKHSMTHELVKALTLTLAPRRSRPLVTYMRPLNKLSKAALPWNNLPALSQTPETIPPPGGDCHVIGAGMLIVSLISGIN